MRAFARAGDLVGQARTLRHQTRVQNVSGAASYGQTIDLSAHERVLEQLGEREPLIRGALLDVMSQVFWTSRETSRAEALARQALSIPEKVGDDQLHHQASFSLGLALFQGGNLQAAHTAFEASHDYAERVGDTWASITPLQRMAVLQIAFGRLDDATSLSQAARALTTQVCHSGVRHALDQPGVGRAVPGADDASGVLVSFSDQGPGIPEARRDKIWGRFYTTDAANGGSGLGIAIVESVARSHGGRVALQTSDARSRFSIWLPVA